MKTIRYPACLLLPALLVSCGLFIAPRNDVMEVTLQAKVDGKVEQGGAFDFAGPITWAFWSGPKTYTLMKFEDGRIPLGAQILSAKLRMQVSGVPDEGDVIVHRIRQDWDPSVSFTTVDTPGGFYDSEGHSTYIDPSMAGRDVSWEIRKIVQSWANGLPNFGVLLEGSPMATFEASVEFFTTEGGHTPELYVRYY